jgi:geranylgeranyl diphosphate synthase type I
MSHKKGKLVVAKLRKGSEKGLGLAKQILQAEKMEPPKLRRAFEHYLEHWDDITHAGLFSMACEAVGGNPDDSVLAQAAIAMMAAAFDLHDDILDKSKEKNKIPTVYGKFGVEMALLLGNAFLIEGFKIFADSTTIFPKEKRKNILETTKNLLFEVGNAHSLEICLKQRKRVTPNDYMMITKLKAASIEADLMLGALFGGGDETEVANLAKLGRIIGILATLRDDLVDVFDIEELRQRILVQDLPLPLLFAMHDKETKTRILSILSGPKMTQSAVSELVDLTLKAKPVAKMKNRMQLLINEGLSLSNKLPRMELQSNLQTVVSFMLEDL